MEHRTALGWSLIQHRNIINENCNKNVTFRCRASSSALSFSAFFRSFARRFFSFSFSFCFSFCRCSSSWTETTPTSAGESQCLSTLQATGGCNLTPLRDWGLKMKALQVGLIFARNRREPTRFKKKWNYFATAEMMQLNLQALCPGQSYIKPI